MSLVQLIQNQYLSIIFGGAAGVATAWATQRILNKRGVFSYSVNHQQVGLSAEDVVLGSVAVTWNGNPIQNLYLSTLEVKNESLNDYENVVVRAYTDNTQLLTEQTHILETPSCLEWTDKYKKQVHIDVGQEPTDAQRAIYFGQREYRIPVFNRGQTVRIAFLNSLQSGGTPSIWLSALQKGVKVKFQNPQREILGIPAPRAALAGVIVGLLGLVPLVLFVPEGWIVALVALVYGLVVILPATSGHGAKRLVVPQTPLG